MAADPARGVLIRRRAIRGALSNAVGQVIGLVALFILTPYILARIGASGYGLWVLVGSLAAYGGLLDLGIGSAVVKYVAEHRARRDADASRALIATALRLYLALGALAFVLSLGVAAVFPDLFVAPADRQTASLLVVLTGLNLGISIAAAPTTSVLVGIQRFDLYNVVGAGSTLLWAATTVVALAAGAGVVGMVALNVPITLLMRVLSLRFIRQAAPDLPFGYAGASRAAAATVFGYSASIFASQISDLLQKKTDEIVVAAAIAVSAVTPYAIGRRLSEITHVLTNQFVRVLLPIASELYATNDRERLVTLYLVSTRVTITLFASIGLPIVLLAGQILTVWVGPGFEDAVPVIGILTAASFLLTSVWPAGSVLQGMARFRLVAISSVASGVANLVLSVVLAARLGIVGVAVGTFVPTAAETIGFVLPYTMWVLHIRPARALLDSWLPALVPALPAALVIVGLREVFAPASLVVVGIVAACGWLTYIAVYLLQPATAMERHAALDVARLTASFLGRMRIGGVAAK